MGAIVETNSRILSKKSQRFFQKIDFQFLSCSLVKSMFCLVWLCFLHSFTFETPIVRYVKGLDYSIYKGKTPLAAFLRISRKLPKKRSIILSVFFVGTSEAMVRNGLQCPTVSSIRRQSHAATTVIFAAAQLVIKAKHDVNNVVQ